MVVICIHDEGTSLLNGCEYEVEACNGHNIILTNGSVYSNPDKRFINKNSKKLLKETNYTRVNKLETEISNDN